MPFTRAGRLFTTKSEVSAVDLRTDGRTDGQRHRVIRPPAGGGGRGGYRVRPYNKCMMLFTHGVETAKFGSWVSDVYG